MKRLVRLFVFARFKIENFKTLFLRIVMKNGQLISSGIVYLKFNEWLIFCVRYAGFYTHTFTCYFGYFNTKNIRLFLQVHVQL